MGWSWLGLGWWWFGLGWWWLGLGWWSSWPVDGRAGEINTGLEKWPLQKSNEDLLDLLLLDKKFQLTKIFRWKTRTWCGSRVFGAVQLLQVSRQGESGEKWCGRSEKHPCKKRLGGGKKSPEKNKARHSSIPASYDVFGDKWQHFFHRYLADGGLVVLPGAQVLRIILVQVEDKMGVESPIS